MNKIVLYGAGKRGHGMYEFLKNIHYSDLIYGFCDKKAKEIITIDDKKVWAPEELENEEVTYCITLLDESERIRVENEIGTEKCIDFSELAEMVGMDRIEFNRSFCAFYHIRGMDTYFEEAEDLLEIFWDVNSDFFQLFKQLNLEKVIELGCGRGRHIPNYIKEAGEITLVDILQENIDFCRERFFNETKVKYYRNTGYDLLELKSNAYTAVYSYDAMVHFELMDIYSYLKDIYRILQQGGRALLHHSNYYENYKADFSNAPGSRNFMSKECFAYLAYRVGFTVVEQKVIDWNGVKNLDCITLLEK